MTALLYFLVAVIAVSLATQAWLADREEPTRVAFLALGWTIGLSYLAFSLSLLPGLSGLRSIYTLTGCMVPATALWTIDRTFARDDQGRSRYVALIAIGTALVAPTMTIAHLGFYNSLPRASPPEVLAGTFALVAFAATLRRLWEAHEAAVLRVEKTRLRYLAGVVTGAVVFTVIEQLARSLGPVIDPGGLSLSIRAVALQGAVPPFSVVFAGLSMYFLYHSVVMYRLLDLQELFSRAAMLLGSALLLVLVDGITFMWVDTFTVYPFHSTFQIFLASLMFLAAYDPLRVHISWFANRAFNARGQQLAETLDFLRAHLPSVIATDALVETLLSRLHASGRVPVCSMYLWNQGRNAFVFAGSRGEVDKRPLKAVAAHPFSDGFANGIPWYTRPSVLRRARQDAEQADILGLMDAMNADLTVPFLSGGVVLGWLHLRHESWSDGFSAEEMQRLQQVCGLASVVLSNIQEFKVLEEAQRLAALGAMAAGLAHEIRNPLAGVKGAAQYLQEEDLQDESVEMLHVIIDEVDRLDIVVSQFLDYARPFDLRLEQEHLNALVTHALTLLKAQGLPPEVEVAQELAGDLPSIAVDATRLQQVLINLIRNGLQAMPDGGTLTISTRRLVNRTGVNQAELAVRDTGNGINKVNVEKLFLPFFTTKKDGTGLGLAICHRIVKAHGGDLDVQSRPGKGASFFVRLPLPDEEEDRRAHPSESA
jgi:two-component system, NtrC family, sensor histidine kinase HydH